MNISEITVAGHRTASIETAPISLPWFNKLIEPQSRGINKNAERSRSHACTVLHGARRLPPYLRIPGQSRKNTNLHRVEARVEQRDF